MQKEIKRIPFKRNGCRGKGLTHQNPILASYGFSENFVERFWNFVQKTDHCWLWIGPKNKKGYGMIGPGGYGTTPFKAHRASWILHFGKIPDGLCVLHDCRPNSDLACCVNPSHLWLGTVLDNNKDMDKKGVHVMPPIIYGLRRNFKITLDQAKEIQRLYEIGKYYQFELGKKFGICQQQISHIVNKTY